MNRKVPSRARRSATAADGEEDGLIATAIVPPCEDVASEMVILDLDSREITQPKCVRDVKQMWRLTILELTDIS